MGEEEEEGVRACRRLGLFFFSGRQRRRCVQDRVTVAGRLGLAVLPDVVCGLQTGLQLELSA